MHTHRWICAALTLVVVGACTSGEPTSAVGPSPTLAEAAAKAVTMGKRGGLVVVANRGAGTISVFSAQDDAHLGDYPLPGAGAQPMYVVHHEASKQVLVGDRTNGEIVAFDQRTFQVNGTVPAGAGVFHMWANLKGSQLWVVDDIGNAVTVIDPAALSVIATVPMPADLVATGARPHDVIVDPDEGSAFVTMIGVPGPTDAVVKFSTGDFSETARAIVGDDPHVSTAKQHPYLHVAAQNGNAVHVLERATLSEAALIAVPGAHGATTSRNGRVFYATNLPGGGPDGLFAIDTRRAAVLAQTDAPLPVPHNVVVTNDGRKAYVTHSGATATAVSVYDLGPAGTSPSLATVLQAGLNPFGLAYVH